MNEEDRTKFMARVAPASSTKKNRITSFFKPNKVQNSTENDKISNSDVVENTCLVNNEKNSTSTRLTSNAATGPKDCESTSQNKNMYC